VVEQGIEEGKVKDIIKVKEPRDNYTIEGLVVIKYEEGVGERYFRVGGGYIMLVKIGVGLGEICQLRLGTRYTNNKKIKNYDNSITLLRSKPRSKQ
jgi:hypothetical protein